MSEMSHSAEAFCNVYVRPWTKLPMVSHLVLITYLSSPLPQQIFFLSSFSSELPVFVCLCCGFCDILLLLYDVSALICYNRKKISKEPKKNYNFGRIFCRIMCLDTPLDISENPSQLSSDDQYVLFQLRCL